MTAIWPITSESVRVEAYERHGSAEEGAPPDTSRAFISTPAPCRVVIGVEGVDYSFRGIATIQFVRNPVAGESLVIGPGDGTRLTFVTVPGSDGIVLGATLLETMDNLIDLLRTLGYGADQASDHHVQIRAPGFGPSTDAFIIECGPYAADPLGSERRHFRGGAGTYLPANGEPVEFLASPGDRVFTLGANNCCDSDPAVGGGLTVTWAALPE